MNSRTRRSSLQDHHSRHQHSPSFSSTLLEEIYRSFDQESENHLTDNTDITCRRKNSGSNTHFDIDNRFVVNRWMDNEKVKLRRASLSEGTLRPNGHGRPVLYSSSTSSSGDSCGSGICGFSSSDTESHLNRSSRQKLLPPLKPIRTTVNTAENYRKAYSDEIPPAKKKEGNLHRRALKLYGDLKKVKQPISPGGKLAAFLNSLFHSNASKKPNISSQSPSSNGLYLERESASAPSTASRSCLSKTPSTAGRFEKRSVRFVDDERGHVIRSGPIADLPKRDSLFLASDEELRHQMREKHRRVEEMAKELLRNYHQKNRKTSTVKIPSDHRHHDLRKFGFENHDDGRESEEDDSSCCSSDLFELENWLEIGTDHRYREELPVYETTRFDPNRTIAI